MEFANDAGRDESLKKAADGAGKADVDLSESQFGVAVGALTDEVDVIDADDFAAAGVDDLLVKEIFLHG